MHNTSNSPAWNEVVLTFDPCAINELIADMRNIIVYGTGGRAYMGMVLSYNSISRKYSLICYPDNTQLQYMTTQGEHIRFNAF